MQTQHFTNNNAIDRQLFVKMVLDAWNSHNARFNKLLDQLTTEQLMAEVAPGRNRGVYLTSHLIAVSDGMLPILGFGEKLYPQLDNDFIFNPDKSGQKMPSVDELKKYRDDINARLAAHINQLQPDEWFAKHELISAEDFAKEPHRNKLNIIINRTNHLGYHLGQLVLLAEPAGRG